MNLEKVIFGFFVLLAATLNFGFFIGDIANPDLHNIYELFAALAISLIATVLKRSEIDKQRIENMAGAASQRRAPSIPQCEGIDTMLPDACATMQGPSRQQEPITRTSVLRLERLVVWAWAWGRLERATARDRGWRSSLRQSCARQHPRPG